MIRLILLLWAFPAIASTGWPQKILKEEKFPVPRELESKEIHSIVYGNSDYGFFAQAVKREGRQISVEFFPPGYKKPIEFFAESPLRRVFLGTRQYRSPFAEFGIQPAARVSGRFSSPYFILTWFPTDQTPIPLIFNREGEPVWSLSPHEQNPGTFTRGYLPVKVSSRTLLFIGGQERMAYGLLDMKTGSGPVTLGSPGEILHHSFQYLPESQELVALTYDCRPLRWWEDTSPVFKGLSGWWNLFRLPRRTVMGSQLVRIQPRTGTSRKLWSTFDQFSYRQNRNLALNSEMDRYLDISSAEEYLELKGQPAYKRDFHSVECDADWSHENSVRYYPGRGYLLSIRNFNKILFLNESGRAEWSLGGADDTFRIAHVRDRFSLQHEAWLTADNRILLFDNHVPYRGWLDGRYFSQSRVSEYELRDGEGLRRFALPLPEPRAEIRGSVEPLSGGDILAFDPGEYPQPVRLFQLDPQHGVARAALEIDYPKTYRMLQVRSLDAILDEKFRPEIARPSIPPRIAFDAVIKEIESGY